MSADDFFQPLENTKPFVKAAFEGFAGSGKTRTAAELAIGLYKKIGSTKPIVAFDTEKAIHALKPKFDEAGITVKVKRSRTLADLKGTMAYVRDGYADIMIIDSITHVWEDVVQSYMRSKNRTFMQFDDWGIVKPLWKQEFSHPFVHDPCHAIMCGRAGFEYEEEVNERGKKQIVKAGIKMKAEGETAYEPDILVLMERCEDIIGKEKKIWREATIIKDRSDLIDGKTFKNPTFKAFEPSVLALLSGAYVRPTETDTAAMFEKPKPQAPPAQSNDERISKAVEAIKKVNSQSDLDTISKSLASSPEFIRKAKSVEDEFLMAQLRVSTANGGATQ